MEDVYSNTEKYNPDKECEVSIAFDDIISDMISNKELSTRRIM